MIKNSLITPDSRFREAVVSSGIGSSFLFKERESRA
jgi:hypothetical protein